MKIDILKVPLGGQPATPAHTGVVTGRPADNAKPISTAPPSNSASSVPSVRPRVSHDERRRTQRVLLRVRASIHVALKGAATTFDVFTLNVNPGGALVLMNQSLPPETRLVLEHGNTHQRVACKVVRQPREMPEGFHVPLEFDSPAPDFWKIDFPPADWRPE